MCTPWKDKPVQMSSSDQHWNRNYWHCQHIKWIVIVAFFYLRKNNSLSNWQNGLNYMLVASGSTVTMTHHPGQAIPGFLIREGEGVGGPETRVGRYQVDPPEGSDSVTSKSYKFNRKLNYLRRIVQYIPRGRNRLYLPQRFQCNYRRFHIRRYRIQNLFGRK